MGVVDKPAVQRAIRVPLGLAMSICALGCLALVPVLFGFTIPPGLIAAGLAVWLFQPPDQEPSKAARTIVGIGVALLALEVLLLVGLSLVGPTD
jgi:hypothetical protein